MASTFGSAMTMSARCRMVGGCATRTAPARCSVRGVEPARMVRPSAFATRAAGSVARKSTTRSLTASSAVTATLSRTAFSAQSAFRPRAAATDRTKAAVSFSTFLAMSFPASASTSRPPPVTGWAAPMLEVGCMAATSAARVRKTPAEPAWAPAGPTQSRTGTGLSSIPRTILRVEPRSPPGVSSSMSTASKCSSRARANAASRYSAVPRVMAPSTVAVRTRGGPAARPAVSRSGSAAFPGPRIATAAIAAAPRNTSRASVVRAMGHLRGTDLPSSFITSWRSSQAFFFSSGLRKRYAGWKVGMSFTPS